MDELKVVLDMKLANVYLSLMDADMEMSDADRELFYMHLRMAFLEGEQSIMRQIMPMIEDFQAALAVHERPA